MSGRGAYTSVNLNGDEEHKEEPGAAVKEMYVRAPEGLLTLGWGLLGLDAIITFLTWAGSEDWHLEVLWKHQVTHYSMGQSSLEVMLLLVVRALAIIFCLTRSRAFLIGINKDGSVRRSLPLMAAQAMCVVSSVYAVIKIVYCTTRHNGRSTGWAVSVVALVFALCEARVLTQIQGAVRAITSKSMYEKLRAANGDDIEDTRTLEEQAEDEEEGKGLSFVQLVAVLKPYFWPKGDDERATLNRVRSTATWVFVAGSKACSVTSPFFLSYATNALYDGDIKDTVKNVLLYALLAFLAKALKEAQSLVYLKVKQQAYIEIAERTFSHLHSLSLQWHLKKKMGNVIRSMDRGTEAANNLVSYLFLYLVPAVAECIATVIIFYVKFNDWRLATMAFFSLMVYGYITVRITLWRKKFRAATNRHDNEFHDKSTDSIINYETVKYFTNEEYETRRFCDSVRKYQQFSVSTQASLSLLNVAQQFIMYATLIAGLVFSAQAVDSGDFNVGDFVAVNTYLINLFTPLYFLGTVYNTIIQAFVDIKNLSELLAESPDIVDPPGAPPLPIPPKGSPGMSIEFKNVWFWYPTQPSHRGLRGISFYVAPGTTTALVGHTGAGKTTISRLLFRFYDPMKGQILMNGHDVKTMQQRSVRRAIGVVPQDTVMFNDTILHNVRYGRLGAPMHEVEASAEAAQIKRFIESLPEGWESKVGERGLKLSGGEKQRVAIARCLLKDPPIVLLDEATSALDTRTEQGVQEALNGLSSNRTTVIIAHRLSTVKNADQILVLSEGQIVERGNHEELMASKGEYYQMWKMQLFERQRLLSRGSEGEGGASHQVVEALRQEGLLDGADDEITQELASVKGGLEGDKEELKEEIPANAEA